MENIKENIEIKTEEIKENITITETFEPYVLKVKGGNFNSPDLSKRPTDPIGLSRSILHVLESNPQGFCKVNSVGPTALNATMAGFRLAAIAYSARTKGTVLVNTQSEYTAVVAGNNTRGICTRIFPIPVAFQL